MNLESLSKALCVQSFVFKNEIFDPIYALNPLTLALIQATFDLTLQSFRQRRVTLFWRAEKSNQKRARPIIPFILFHDCFNSSSAYRTSMF
jgi:hypothetical protein